MVFHQPDRFLCGELLYSRGCSWGLWRVETGGWREPEAGMSWDNSQPVRSPQPTWNSWHVLLLFWPEIESHTSKETTPSLPGLCTWEKTDALLLPRQQKWRWTVSQSLKKFNMESPELPLGRSERLWTVDPWPRNSVLSRGLIVTQVVSRSLSSSIQPLNSLSCTQADCSVLRETEA